MKRTLVLLGILCGLLISVAPAQIVKSQQVPPRPATFAGKASVPLKFKPLSPIQQAVVGAIFHPEIKPTQVEQVAPPPPPGTLDHARWQSPIGILYGATFDFSHSPYEGRVEEAYQFVEPDQASTFKIMAYCEENPAAKGNQIQDFCPPQSFNGSEIRLTYQESVAPPLSAVHGYLYEDFVINAKPVWILAAEADEAPKWRFLNYVQNLQDSFGTSGNARMSTIFLPSNTLIALDQAQHEDSPEMDIYHFPGQFLYETLVPRGTVITRVNPKIPGFLHWGVQRLVSVGVTAAIWQWLLLMLTPLTPIAVLGWLWRHFRKRPRAA